MNKRTGLLAWIAVVIAVAIWTERRSGEQAATPVPADASRAPAAPAATVRSPSPQLAAADRVPAGEAAVPDDDVCREIDGPVAASDAGAGSSVAAIAGVVLDDRRQPVAFASVVAKHVPSQRAWRATADAEGRFALCGVERAVVSLHGETASAVSTAANVDLAHTPRVQVEIVLDVAGTISGVVVDERGARVADVMIAAWPDHAHVPPGQSPRIREAISDREGRFVIGGLIDMPYRLYARRRTSRPFPWSIPGTAVHAGDRDVRLELPSDGGITGRLLIGEGTPSSAGVITVSALRVEAASDGSFRADGIPPGSHLVWFMGPDFLSFQRSIDVRPGAITDLGTVTVAHTRTLAGRVVDRTGAPVAGARIEVGVIRPEPVEPDDPPGGFHAHRGAVAAADGTFRVHQVPPTPMIAIASADGAGSSAPIAIPDDRAAPGDPPPVTLVVPGDPR